MRYGDMGGAVAAVGNMAASKTASMGPASSELDAARQRIARQELLIQSLIAVVLEKGLCTKEEFLEMVEQVDMLDGKRDGKLGDEKSANICPACNTRNAADSVRCMWCGADQDTSSSVIRRAATKEP